MATYTTFLQPGLYFRRLSYSPNSIPDNYPTVRTLFPTTILQPELYSRRLSYDPNFIPDDYPTP